MTRPPLPIDPLLPGLAATLQRHGTAVLQAEPGAGKTTRVPPALLDTVAGEVWVVEPRRMAAVLPARHVARERGEPVGATIGYSVRFDDSVGPSTRVRYVTDGIFLRKIASSPTLSGIGAVVFDELHERRLATDLGLGWARRLQAGPRPDLKILAMSATLDVGAVAAWLGDAPIVQATGRVFPVTIEHAATLDQRPLEDQVLAAVRRVLDEGPHAPDGKGGDVLVFLPGAGEIRRCGEVLARRLAADVVIRPLHGSLPLEEQERALQPSPQPKVILATNIAETSVTLPGVVAVIDAGLHRVAGHAAWSGVPTLQLQRISRASATQRAGRAGRTQPGRCLRLYTQHDHDTRPAFDKPEVLRTDLAEAVLLLASLGLRPTDADWTAFWPTPPEPQAIAQARAVLGHLGALDGDGLVTPRGRELLRWPLHPRLATVALTACQAGHPDAGSLTAALLGERDLRVASPPGHLPHGQSDVLALLDAYRKAEASRLDPRTLRDLGLDPQATWQVQKAYRQLQGLARQVPKTQRLLPEDDAIGQAVLAGFADRVARRRAPGSDDLELAGGTSVRLSPKSEATEPGLLVVVDAEERRDARGATTWVRLASGIEADWLLDLFPDRVVAESDLSWTGTRVQQRERLTYLGLVLDESVRPAPPGPQASRLLAEAARSKGLNDLIDADALDRLRKRVRFARESGGLDLPDLDDATVHAALEHLCQGRTSLAQLRDADLLAELREVLQQACGGRGLQLLDAHAPETVQLPGGRKTRVQYEDGQAPWISSRLQDFFGMRQGPALAGGRCPLVLHLLAPNQRPVQVTTDLAGFWQRHYPALRKELGRRYPKHAWPEDPLTAKPPEPRR